jgi:hypothetical protein
VELEKSYPTSDLEKYRKALAIAKRLIEAEQDHRTGTTFARDTEILSDDLSEARALIYEFIGAVS